MSIPGILLCSGMFLTSLALIVWVYLQVLRTRADVGRLEDSWNSKKLEIHDAMERFAGIQAAQAEIRASILSNQHAVESLHESLSALSNKWASRIRAEKKEMREQADPDQVLMFPPAAPAAIPPAKSPGGRVRLYRKSAG